MADFAAQDGRKLRFEDTGGTGPAILCLAGLTRNMRDFDHLETHLAPRYRVIRLDARGRGGSDWAEDPVAEYTVPVETNDALGLITHLDLERIAIIGSSRGGILGMAIAAAVPGLVSCLVLNDIGAEIEIRGLEEISERIGTQPNARDYETAARNLQSAFGDSFPGLPLSRWETHAEAIYNRDPSGSLTLAYDPRLADAVDQAMEGLEGDRVDLWQLFEGCSGVPVLVIRGENSDILTHETVARMGQRHPQLVSLEVTNRGHAPFLDEPEVLEALNRHLEEYA